MILHLKNKTKHENLYAWCLQEINNEGAQVGQNFIPWNWRLNFTGFVWKSPRALSKSSS